MALGSPLAFVLGGGPDPAEKAYLALRSAVGKGNSAPGGPRDTLREAWRYARARGLAAVVEEERAVAQISPGLATDFIPVYEQILGLFFPLSASDQERRDALTARWVQVASAVGPTVAAALIAIDPSITVEVIDHALTREVQHGRVFEDWDPVSSKASGPAFSAVAGSAPRCTEWPNYSDEFHLYVSLPLGSGVMTVPGARAIAQVNQLLNQVLPSWVDFNVFTSATGFILDRDLLDVTAFGS